MSPSTRSRSQTSPPIATSSDPEQALDVRRGSGRPRSPTPGEAPRAGRAGRGSSCPVRRLGRRAAPRGSRPRCPRAPAARRRARGGPSAVSPRPSARSSVRPSGPSGSSPSSAARQRSSKRRSAASWSSTVISGSIPASAASVRSSALRRRRGWWRAAPGRDRSGPPHSAVRRSVGAASAAASSSRPARTRSRSSAAARSVKVMAAIRSIGVPDGDQRDHPVHQRPRLAGAGAGLHEHRGVEALADLRAGPRRRALTPLLRGARPPAAQGPTPALAALRAKSSPRAARADAREVAAAAVVELRRSAR